MSRLSPFLCFDPWFEDLLTALGQSLTRRRLTLATAESCTGGLVAAACTEIAGSSAWFAGGVVAYDNRLKRELLDVPANLLDTCGAVSREVVEAMARGALFRCGAGVTLAISGVAGPAGGSPAKPVGTVCIAWADAERCYSRRFLFPGDRAAVRAASVLEALAGLARVLGE